MVFLEQASRDGLEHNTYLLRGSQSVTCNSDSRISFRDVPSIIDRKIIKCTFQFTQNSMPIDQTKTCSAISTVMNFVKSGHRICSNQSKNSQRESSKNPQLTFDQESIYLAIQSHLLAIFLMGRETPSHLLKLLRWVSPISLGI